MTSSSLTKTKEPGYGLSGVVPNLKNKAGSTLKSYLGSLQKFLDFASKKLNRPYLPEQTRDAFERLETNHNKGDIQGQLEEVSEGVRQPAHIQQGRSHNDVSTSY